MGKKRQSKTRLTVQYRGGYKDRAGNYYTEAEGQMMLQKGDATLTQWKARKTPVEVTPGRKKGSPNLKRVDGGYQNQYGVTFTPQQKKDLERSVNRSNYYRDKMLRKEGELPRTVGGKPTGQKVSQLQLMGKESDFIISRQPRGLQSFKSMEDYERFMDKQARIQSGEYLDDMTRHYKRNHMKAIENVFGDEAKDVVMKIRMMKPEDYRELIQKDEMLEVSYVYDPSAKAGKLNQIRQSLGMKTKEEDLFSPLDD